MPNGIMAINQLIDHSYDGIGNPQATMSPLQGGLGLLTDKHSPTAGAFAEPESWVGWAAGPPTISFHFCRPVEIDSITLRLDASAYGPTGQPLPARIDLHVGEATTSHPVSLEGSEPIDFELRDLGLVGRSVDITLEGGDPLVVLGEVSFAGHVLGADAEGLPSTEECWVPGPSGPIWRTYEIESGYARFQGDILFPLGELRLFQLQTRLRISGELIEPQSAILIDRGWPGGLVPYVILDESVDPATGATHTWAADQREWIADAAAEWTGATPLQLEDWTAAYQAGELTETDNYIEFRPVAEGCASALGMRAAGRQPIILSQACSRGNILHEIGHAVGLFHEQSRVDRDDHVDILTENIKDGPADDLEKWRSQFMTYQQLGWLTGGLDWGEYNYRSIMHYDTDAASIDPCNPYWPEQPCLETIVPWRLLPDRIIGQRAGLSRGDIAAVRAKYGYFGATDSYHSLSWLQLSELPDDPAQYELGDVDGDGLDDLITFTKSAADASWGDVHVAFADPDGDFEGAGGFEDAQLAHPSFCVGDEVCRVADLNGGGRADILAYDQAAGRVWVAESSGSGFHPSEIWLDNYMAGYEWEAIELGDVDGDCRDDLVVVLRWSDSNYYAYVMRSTGSGFVGALLWSGQIERRILIGDLHGDGLADLVSLADNGDVYVHPSDGTSFGAPELWASGFCPLDNACRLVDMDGDRRQDIVGMNAGATHIGGAGLATHALDRLRVGLSTGLTISTAANFHEMDCRNPERCVLGDVDGDGHADVVDGVTRTEDIDPAAPRLPGYVWVSRSTGIWSDPTGPKNAPWYLLQPANACGPQGVPQ
jgi:hypothetical protein